MQSWTASASCLHVSEPTSYAKELTLMAGEALDIESAKHCCVCMHRVLAVPTLRYISKSRADSYCRRTNNLGWGGARGCERQELQGMHAPGGCCANRTSLHHIPPAPAR